MSNEPNDQEEKTQKNPETTKFQTGRIPWNKGKKCPRKSKAESMDDNTVKINIIKEAKPLPPKDFEGKLEDLKERTAINFINSIIANKPKCVNIDGRKFYSDDVVSDITYRLKETRELNREAEEVLDKCLNTMKDMADVTKDMETVLHKTTFSRMCWRAVAIGLAIGGILGGILLSLCLKFFR